MANNREQTRLDQLAAKAGRTRKQYVVREFFRLGKVKPVAQALNIPETTLRDMLAFDMHLSLKLVALPAKTDLLTDEQYRIALMDWLAEFAIREAGIENMPNTQRLLRKP